MRELSATLHVASPADFTAAFIEQYLRDLAGSDGKIKLPLRVPSDAFGVPGDLNLERDVEVHIARAAASTLRIEWHPVGGGAYPTFDGSLEASPSDGAALLKLAGTYTVPGGAAGWLFDEVAGFQIAQATADDLLERLRDACETDYAVRSVDDDEAE